MKKLFLLSALMMLGNLQAGYKVGELARLRGEIVQHEEVVPEPVGEEGVSLEGQQVAPSDLLPIIEREITLFFARERLAQVEE